MLEEKAQYAIKKHHLLSKGDRLLLGVSGGPDSLALLHYLYSIRKQYSLELTVAHMDHMFRGQQSYDEYLFVKAFCTERGIPFEGIQVDVPKYIEQTGKTTQVAARELRYQFFDSVMKEHGIHKLALGHHGDDQVETILMRLTRGASGKARAGIAYRRVESATEVIRPFLWASKEEIEQYCHRHGLEPQLDASNMKPVYARNRYRLQVLPFLKTENPKVHEHFQRFSEELLEDEEFLLKMAEEKMQPFWMKKKNYSKIEISSFLNMSKPLQRRGIQLILNYLYFERHVELSAAHIESVIKLFKNSHPSGEIHLPAGLKVEKSYDFCTFSFEERVQEAYSIPLHIPGVTMLPNGHSIEAKYIEDEEEEGNHLFILDPAQVKLPLMVRTRKPGDRMKLKGLNGTKKVKDIFIEKKIPLTERVTWPLLVDNNQQIIWIPGLKKSSKEAVRVSKSFITLKFI
ncbi:MAG: tRNA lysidine(34) synthetase TilS [Bacillus sp. (in: firmicutes)]